MNINWITLLYTWNQHNIVNQLYSNKIFLKNWFGCRRKSIYFSTLTLIFEISSDLKKWQRQYTKFLYTFLTAFPNINILPNKGTVSKIKKLTLTMILLTNLQILSIFTNCPTNVLFQTQVPGSQIAFSCHGFSVSYNLKQSSVFLCLSWSWYFWIVLANMVEWSSVWVCLIFSHDSFTNDSH